MELRVDDEGVPLGSAFVTFASPSAAARACHEIAGLQFEGRLVRRRSNVLFYSCSLPPVHRCAPSSAALTRRARPTPRLPTTHPQKTLPSSLPG